MTRNSLLHFTHYLFCNLCFSSPVWWCWWEVCFLLFVVYFVASSVLPPHTLGRWTNTEPLGSLILPLISFALQYTSPGCLVISRSKTFPRSFLNACFAGNAFLCWFIRNITCVIGWFSSQEHLPTWNFVDHTDGTNLGDTWSILSIYWHLRYTVLGY